jgi:hypothetical protein
MNKEEAKSLVGQSETEVRRKLTESGFTIRLSGGLMTCDFHINRANITVKDGIVTKITFG